MGSGSGSEDSAPELASEDSSAELSSTEDSPAWELASMASSQAVRQREARVRTARSSAKNLFIGSFLSERNKRKASQAYLLLTIFQVSEAITSSSLVGMTKT
jgi:hypothetical protein